MCIFLHVHKCTQIHGSEHISNQIYKLKQRAPEDFDGKRDLPKALCRKLALLEHLRTLPHSSCTMPRIGHTCATSETSTQPHCMGSQQEGQSDVQKHAHMCACSSVALLHEASAINSTHMHVSAHMHSETRQVQNAPDTYGQRTYMS